MGKSKKEEVAIQAAKKRLRRGRNLAVDHLNRIAAVDSDPKLKIARDKKARKLGVILDLAHLQRKERDVRAYLENQCHEKGRTAREKATKYTSLIKLTMNPGGTDTNRFAKLILHAQKSEWTGEQFERRYRKNDGIPGLARKYKWFDLLSKPEREKLEKKERKRLEKEKQEKAWKKKRKKQLGDKYDEDEADDEYRILHDDDDEDSKW